MAMFWFRRVRKALRRFVQDRHGTVAIEFAFVLVAFLTILFGILAFGFQFVIRVALSYAVAEGGRSAVAGLTSVERQSRAQTAITAVLNSFSPMIDPSKSAILVSSGGMTANGESILIEVDYSDSRFNIFPYMPVQNTNWAVRTTFFVADPSG